MSKPHLRRRSIGVLGTPHQGLVVGVKIILMLLIPAASAKVAETRQLATEVRALLDQTVGARRILQVRINLNLSNNESNLSSCLLMKMDKYKHHYLRNVCKLLRLNVAQMRCRPDRTILFGSMTIVEPWILLGKCKKLRCNNFLGFLLISWETFLLICLQIRKGPTFFILK